MSSNEEKHLCRKPLLRQIFYQKRLTITVCYGILLKCIIMDWCAPVRMGYFNLCIIAEILNKISAIMTKENQKSGQSTQMRQKNPNFPGSGKEETPGTV